MTGSASPPQRRPRLLWASVYCLMDTSSGASMAVREMLLQLLRQDYEVQVLGATVFDDERGTVGLRGQWPAVQASQGGLVELTDAPLLHRLVVTASPQRDLMTAREEAAWLALYQQSLDLFKPDVVFYYGGQPLDLLIASEARVRAIPTAFYLVNGNYTKGRWCRDVDLVLTDSGATAAMYRNRFGIEVAPIGAFIDPVRVLAPERTAQRILFVNPRLEKGVALVIRLAMLLERRRPDIVFEVVESRGNWSEMLRMISAAYGPPREALDNVVVTPNTGDMRPVYGRARLLLAPSLWWESGARVLAEAMLNGIPAIITDCGGSPEMVQDGGITLKLGDVYHEAPYGSVPVDEALGFVVERLESLFDDEALYADLAARALRVGQTRHQLGTSTRRLMTALQPLFDRRAGDADSAAVLRAWHRHGLDEGQMQGTAPVTGSLNVPPTLDTDGPQVWTDRATQAFLEGKIQDSADYFERSLRIAPNQPAVLSNRGLALHALARLHEALACFDQVLVLQPDHAPAHFKRANVLFDLHRFEEALAGFDRALVLQPDWAEACNNRGNALQALQRSDEALASFERALALRPQHLEAWLNRGNLLQRLDRLAQALDSFDRVLALQPDNIQAMNNRATVLQALQRSDEALQGYDHLLQIQPEHAQALVNRATALQELDRYEEALAAYQRALALAPAQAQAHWNYGTALQDLNRLDEALLSFDRALTLDPQDAHAQWNKALLKLKMGDFTDGWRLYESGWKMGQRGLARNFHQPLWLGDEDIKGKTLLIHPEQGLGDFVQFCRYAVPLQSRGARVILEAPATLMPLVATLPGQIVVLEQGAPLPDFDFHCPVMSLPLACRTTLQTIAAPTPYLHASEEKFASWRQKLGPKTATRVGLAWSGSNRHRNDRRRSVPLELLEPLLALPLEFHSLQTEVNPADAAILAGLAKMGTHQAQLTDFAETAALISQLDLVICVDTCVAHVAGAMGKEVWILLPFAADYRWLQDRSDSPWYPSATLFRQAAIGDWKGVVSVLKDRLEARYQ